MNIWLDLKVKQQAKCQVTAFLVFIRIVTTVVRAVTHPVVEYAAVVPTFKLVGCAKFVCRGKISALRMIRKILWLT